MSIAGVKRHYGDKTAWSKCLPDKHLGWVAEWSKAAVLKTAVGESPPGVRILSHPLLQTSPLPPGEGRVWVAEHRTVVGTPPTYQCLLCSGFVFLGCSEG